jgi:predicted NACHT family NTPase
METFEYTFKALAEFASHLGQQEFTETQARLVSWLRKNLDFGMSARTLQTHTKALCTRGKLSIRYTGEGICYSFPDGVVKRWHVKQVHGRGSLAALDLLTP